jgi:uncharacterized protein YbjT (DUF2867 family)
VILLTGATGYVGGRLLHHLEAEGLPVRCLARRPEQLRHQVADTTEVAGGDVCDPDAMARALRGVSTAYYLVHSMGTSSDFESHDRVAANVFATAAAACGVRRIVYLGGLGDANAPLSAHLRSRQEVGRILARSGVETIELRASIVIGSGSLSFELIRALVERLPAMVTPRWVEVPAQPIGIEDVLSYLRAALDLPISGSRVYEIGGPDRVSYGGLMREYARQRGLRRLMVPIPLLTPRLSSLWLRLVTPLYASIGRKLIDSIRYPTVVEDDAALRDFPIQPIGASDAIVRALANEDRAIAETRWSDALSAAGDAPGFGGVRFGNRLVDSRSVSVAVSPEAAFAPIQRIGGTTGWYYGTWLWQIRGAIDLLCGGVGLRRGRRDPEQLRVGETLDFWRVEAIEPPRLLRLIAEMKVPGRAWLEFEVVPEAGGARIRQIAHFDPAGLAGLAYWYGIYPLHRMVFAGMLRAIARAASETHRGVPCIPIAARS